MACVAIVMKETSASRHRQDAAKISTFVSSVMFVGDAWQLFFGVLCEDFAVARDLAHGYPTCGYQRMSPPGSNSAWTFGFNCCAAFISAALPVTSPIFILATPRPYRAIAFLALNERTLSKSGNARSGRPLCSRVTARINRRGIIAIETHRAGVIVNRFVVFPLATVRDSTVIVRNGPSWSQSYSVVIVLNGPIVVFVIPVGETSVVVRDC